MEGLRLVLAALLLPWAGLSAAQPAEPAEVRLEAPQEVVGLLRRHLSVLRDRPAVVDALERARLEREARREIVELLATEGYFSPEVEFAPAPAEGGPGLGIAVRPGERASISDVSIEFAGHAAASPAAAGRIAALRDGWSLPVGAPFTQQAWDQAKRALLQGLLAEDYAAAKIVDSLAEVDAQRARVSLSVVVDSGPPFTLGGLEVTGLRTYDAELISRYLRIEPGERYRLAKLLDAQVALQSTPYFSSVEIDVERDPSRSAQTPVRVSVAEARRQRLGFGVGYSTNTGERAEAIYQHFALFGRPWHLTSGLSLERDRTAAFADVALPPTRKGYLDRFGVLAEETEIQGLEVTRAALGALRSRRRGRIENTWGLNFQREQKRVAGLETETNDALTLDWTWILRAVDSAVDPRSGYVWTVRLGGASRALLSSRDFFRSYTRLQLYLPMGERDVVILRGEAGLTAALARRGIPQDFLFRAGGAQSVRGYAYKSLGVKEGSAVVGGRALATASAEYVKWVTPEWGAAAFVDAGDAADERKDFRPRVGYGLGARWRSPAGPLALDLAYGHHEARLRLHFSVAIAF